MFKKSHQSEVRAVIAMLINSLPVEYGLCPDKLIAPASEVEAEVVDDVNEVPSCIRRYCNRRMSKRKYGPRNTPRSPRTAFVPGTKRLGYESDGTWSPKNADIVELTFAAIRELPESVFVRTPHSDPDVKLFTSKLVVSSTSKHIVSTMNPGVVSDHATQVRVSISITNMCERIVAIATDLMANDADGVYTDAKMVQQKGTETTGWKVRATHGAGIALNCIAEARDGLFFTALDELERRFRKVTPIIVEEATTTTTTASSSTSDDDESENDDKD
jgi:hypothetical protein